MADPVGLVSLGIEVCKGLVKYYNLVKNSSQDVSTMCQSLLRIQSILDAIKHKIERPELHGKDAELIDKCIEQCRGAITRLQTKLQKFEPSGSQGKTERFKDIAHRLRYPFEKTTLLEIKADVSDIRADLTEAMWILHMDISLQSHKKIEYVENQISKNLIPIVDGIRIAGEDRAAQEKRNAILMWLTTLSPSPFTERHNASLERRKEGTGLWIFEEEGMKQWLNGTVSTLWCPGDPGSGKSVAMSIIVEYLERLREKEKFALAYTYCFYNQEHQTATNFMASILAQFGEQLTASCTECTELDESWKTYHAGSAKPSSPEYVRLLKAVRGKFSKAFILVDALDEFPEAERRSLVRDLKTLVPEIRILVTSRNIPSICSHFQDAARMQIQAREEDVRAVLAARIDEDFSSLAMDEDPTLSDDILNTITQKTKGMFLIVDLHLKALSGETTIRDLREKLGELPSGIINNYKDTMIRIDSQKPRQAERARQVLCWLVHAQRPLRARELQQALAVRSTDTTYVHGGETKIDVLLSYCMGLAIMDRQEYPAELDPITGDWQSESVDIIRFVHYTAQEFFEDPSCKFFPNGHQIVAQTCLSTLLLSNFDIEACIQAKGGEELAVENSKILLHLEDAFPIVRYASQHWGDHARLALEADATSSVNEEIRRLLRKPSNFILSAWVKHLRDQLLYTRLNPDLSAPHVIAGFGITSMLQEAFDMLNEVDVDTRNSLGQTPLHLACQNGHYSTMIDLLKRGADKDALSRRHWNPLHFAVRNGHQEIVRRLLDVDAEILPMDTLESAIRRGQVAVVKMLLQRVGNDELGHALISAAGCGEESTVRTIVEMMQPLCDYQDLISKALVSTTRAFPDNPSINIPLMSLLLEKGADPNYEADGFIEKTPLSWAAGSLQAVKFLVEKGARVNFRDHGGCTALHSRYLTRETCTFFIAQGVNVNGRDIMGRTPLHTAATENPEVLSNLLDNGAEVDAQDVHGMTPLNIAAEKNHLDHDCSLNIARLLRDGADVDLKDKRGYSPLHHAVFGGDLTACETFLESSKVVRDRHLVFEIARMYDSMHKYGQQFPNYYSIDGPPGPSSPTLRTSLESEIAVQLDLIDQRQLEAHTDLIRLKLPCQLGLDFVVRRFLAAGADLKVQGDEALETTLRGFTNYDHEDSSIAILELLVDHGLSINSRNELGSLLYRVIELGSTKAVAMLLRKGADTNIGGCYGTPLMVAACRGHQRRQTLELLLKHKAGVNRAYTDTVESISYGIYSMIEYRPAEMTALHMCAASDESSQDDVRLLLSHGANLEAKNGYGDTPLTLAVRCGRPTTTAALLAEGADTTGPSLLTKKDRISQVYEVDFRTALCLVQKAHSQRIAESRCSPTTLSHRTTNSD